MTDESKFGAGLDIEECKQLIFWANVGFADELSDDTKSSEASNLDYERVISTHEYFEPGESLFVNQ